MSDGQTGADMIGLVIAGELTIERRLAEGGMGAVYVAMQRSTGKRRAVKLMHREIARDPDFQRRFTQEAQIGARIQSDHIVDVLAAGIDAPTGLPYLVMELLEGEDLRHRLSRGALSIDETRIILEQLCHAMDAGHAAGVVHRDLKPENVFLQQPRRAFALAVTVKVLDFGIAKVLLEASTRSTRGAVGSPLYMAPEQTAPGPVTAAADVWALGLLTYEMLVGKSFWRAGNDDGGSSVTLLREIVLDSLPSATARAAEYGLEGRLPPGFDAWFSRCVRREVSERFRDAAALREGLPSALTGSSSPALTAQALAATVPLPPMPVNARTETPATRPLVVIENTGAHATDVELEPVPATSRMSPAQTPPPPRNDTRAGVPPETPIATVQGALPPSKASDPRVIGAILVAIVSLAVAVVAVALSRGAAISPPSLSVSSDYGSIPAIPSSSADVALPRSSAETSAPPPQAVASITHPRPTRMTMPSDTASAPPPPTAPSTTSVARNRVGFSDPSDGPATTKVDDRLVRLLVQLKSNESNVVDSVVRTEIEHNAWRYLRCYASAFKGAKELPELTVIIGFDILDKLPQHARVEGSSSPSKELNECVLAVVVGQTLNSASSAGSGHAVEAFRFIPMSSAPRDQ